MFGLCNILLVVYAIFTFTAFTSLFLFVFHCLIKIIIVIFSLQAFRDVGNVKGNNNNSKDDTTALAAKKSTIVPVEQFKTFSVYEDYNEVEEVVQHQQQSVVVITKQNETTAATATSHDVVDKENVYHQKQQQHRFQQHILTDRR